MRKNGVKLRPRLITGITASFIIISMLISSAAIVNNGINARKVVNIENDDDVKAMGETDPTANWDLNRVYPVLSEDNICVPVPIGWSISSDENERYVNGNVTKKGTVSSLTFTPNVGDANPWTENDSNIWVSGNYQVANSTSELISDPITVGSDGGWVEVEWSVCSQSGYDVLYMYVNDTVNSTTELIGEITGTPYGTAEASLIYTKCGKELSQGTYTISIKYTKYNNATHTGLDSGYVKSGTFINYDENGADTLDIHKTGGFVIYEGTEEVTDTWTASQNRNQFVWVPVTDSSRIYETNSTTGKMKAKLWNTTATGRTAQSNSDVDTKGEAGVLGNQSYDGINYMSDPDYGSMPGYSKDTLYKELETEYMNTIKSIEKYGGFYIGRYETGDISSNIPVVRRMNITIGNKRWYKMYPKMRNISSNENIQTSMIWGSLYDEVLEWIIETGDKARVEISKDSTRWGNYRGCGFTYTNTSGTTLTKYVNISVEISTGSAERNMANNIYDLAGNVWEFTLEGSGVSGRYYRGGNYYSYGNGNTATMRSSYGPDYSSVSVGFRAYFYIK